MRYVHVFPGNCACGVFAKEAIPPIVVAMCLYVCVFVIHTYLYLNVCVC